MTSLGMLTRMTWFLVDDDPDDREIFFLALKKMDRPIDCQVAKDGIEALEKLKVETFTPDCIILDLNMPFMDGKKCLIEIKKIERLKKIPVYIYSTSSESKLKDELKHLGAEDYIEKPSSISLLGEIITELYDRVEKVMAE
jgi:CheY-like chemotaxis protein